MAQKDLVLEDLYGDNYRNVVYSPDEQEKLAKHLYGKKAAEGPQALGNTWVALKNRPSTTISPTADTYDSPSSALNKTGTSSGVSSAIAPVAAVGTVAGINRLFSTDDDNQKVQLPPDEPVGSFGIVGRMMDPVNKYRKLQPYLTKQVMLKRKTQRTNVPVMRKANKPNSPIRFKSFRQAIQEQIIKDNSEDSENL
jgi:hypothetical protein